MTGQFCIEPENGRVWRATLNFKESVENVEGSFEVIFRPTSDLSVADPGSGWEWSLSQDPSRARQAVVRRRAGYLPEHAALQRHHRGGAEVTRSASRVGVVAALRPR